ncbi:MAG: Ig-like domain-containing protein [Gemmataceae bacterium]|nr:Ig-like domain-containing protein [Gemmataceae bacterium]
MAGNMVVVFSEAMDAASINSGTVRLKDAAGNVLTGAVTYDSANHSATIDPANDLAFSTSYTVEVLSGAAGVKDAAGTAMAATFSSAFTTAADAAPSVTSVTPASGATGVAVGSNITVVFSKAMDAATIHSGTVRLKDAAGNVLAASISYNSANNSATIDPANSLVFSTSYTVEVLGGAGGVKDAAGTAMTATFTSTFTTAADPNAQFIITPYDKIPNFGANPTIVSLHSGNWSDPATWGGRLPGAGDIVSIASTFTVTYDLVSDAALNTVVIQAGGKLIFRTDVSTRLTVVNFLVLEGGELTIGTEANPVAANVKAEVVFANIPLNTALDPSQYGNGLIALGKVTMHGAVKDDTFVRLAVEPRAGDTTLTLSEAVTGWRVGDQILLPDSRQLAWNEQGIDPYYPYVPMWETGTIAAVSLDGRTVTLSSPLAFNHPGARGIDGTLDFLPHIANLTRNVVVRSQSATGTRGHAMFIGRADVDIRFARFGGLGRTTIADLDNTLYDANGNLTHVGTNQAGRYPVHFSHLVGPAAAPTNGYQYTFVGNAVVCPLNPMPFIWGIDINDSHYGLVKDNVLYNWAGSGLVTETGSESFNVIEHNFVARVSGIGGRADGDIGPQGIAREGSGIWLRGPNNYVRDNVATTIVNSSVTSYGFILAFINVRDVRIPRFQGADPSQAGQYVLANMNATAIREFSGNETYGAISGGLSYWWIGTMAEDYYADAPESVISGFTVWHHYNLGVFGYQSNNLTFDGLTIRGDNALFGGGSGATGFIANDYLSRNLTFKNADIQSQSIGIIPSSVSAGTVQTFRDSYLANFVNIKVTTLWTSGARADTPHLAPRRIVVDNVFFDLARAPVIGGIAPLAIQMDFRPETVRNLIQLDEVFVYNYNGDPNDDFRVYYLEQASTFVVPKTQTWESFIYMLGSPVEGLTNAQTWALYGIAIGGAIAPSDAAMRLGFKGLTVDL